MSHSTHTIRHVQHGPAGNTEVVSMKLCAELAIVELFGTGVTVMQKLIIF